VAGLLDSVPMLAELVERRTEEMIDLSNRITIAVHTASYRAVRGYTIVGAILDEIAVWRSDDSANPDVEIINSIRPGMLTVPGALLLAISSPYARRGAMFEAHKTYYGHDDADVFVWQAPSWHMNPSLPEADIRREFDRDPAAAAAEYGAQFRRDIEAYIPQDAIERCVIENGLELPPAPKTFKYVAAVDPSGGSQDSMTLCIAHSEERDGVARAVIDLIREVRPPFSPEEVVAEFAATLANYEVASVVGDRFGGEFCREPLCKLGIGYELSEKSKSETYVAFLPVLTSRAVEILDHPRLLTQLASLERRTSRGTGRDIVDHPPNGHDDVANVVAAAALLAVAKPPHRPRAGFGWFTAEQRAERERKERDHEEIDVGEARAMFRLPGYSERPRKLSRAR
jgi:hypothetical protein